jgi:hypothetical protein
MKQKNIQNKMSEKLFHIYIIYKNNKNNYSDKSL